VQGRKGKSDLGKKGEKAINKNNRRKQIGTMEKGVGGHRKKYRKGRGKQARDNEERETANNLLVGVELKEVL